MCAKLDERFEDLPGITGMFTDDPVLVIVNVDNNPTRLAVREWLANRDAPGIMVVSGCERTFGQAYAGLWEERRAIHDWLVLHPDVVKTGERRAGEAQCNVQTAYANMMTATCSGMMLDHVAKLVSYGSPSGPPRVNEYSWDNDHSGYFQVITVGYTSLSPQCEEVISDDA